MLYSKYTIVCSFRENGTLSSFKGSALRGAFGTALKRAVCTTNKRDCTQCILNKSCLFTKIFFSIDAENKNSPSQIKPYIIEPPKDVQQVYNKGDVFSFKLILLGTHYEMLPFLVYAFELMGGAGIGRSQERERGHTVFSIDEIIACHDEEHASIYDTQKQQLLQIPQPQSLQYAIPEESTSNSKILLTLETPLRFKADNRFANTLPFEQLCRLMMRRVSSLYACFDEQELQLDYKKLLEQAQNVCTVHTDIQWQDYDRYSSRQQQALKLGGIVGTVLYEGQLGPFATLLDLATLLHLGKQTSFGLGKVNFSEVE